MSPSAANSSPGIGHIGRYTLRHRVGEGGLGTVFAAHDPVQDRLIALKTVRMVLNPRQKTVFNTVFLSAARAAARLSHPYIAMVYDAGISEQGAYVAMELLQGRHLRQLSMDGWRASPTQAAEIVRRVADALAYAHSRGVVHGDIKPANIFMVGETQPRVLDFGVDRKVLLNDGLISEELLGGLPNHVAPEILLQQSVDGRCDVFSLGAVLYGLLTHVCPFQGNSLDTVMRAVLEHSPPQAHERVPNVPPALSEIAARAMAKNPDDRMRSASVLSRELSQWLSLNKSVQRAPAAKVDSVRLPRRSWIAVASLVGFAGIGLGAWLVLWPAMESQPTRSDANKVSVAIPAILSTPAAPPMATHESQTGIAQARTLMIPETPVNVAATSEGTQPVSAPLAAPTTPQIVQVPAPVTSITTQESIKVTASSKAAQPVPELIAATETPDVAKAPAPVSAKQPAEVVASAEAATRIPTPAAATATGTLLIAVSPWGQVEVDGVDKGTAPPLRELTLPQGKHTITLRNADLPLRQVTVNVTPGRPVTLKHQF